MAKKKAKSNNAIANIVAALLVLAIGAGGVCCVGYVSRNDEGKWFSNPDLASWHWADNKEEDNGNKDDNKDEDNGNLIITGGNSDSGVSVYSAVLPRTAYEANGISENADTAIKLTATIKPDYAYNKKVTWAVKWQDETAEWAQGKTVTDYVTIDSISDLEANAICLQAFGEPIEITCTIEGTEIKAICKADYVKKVTDVNVVSGMTKQDDGSYLWIWNNYEVDELVLLEQIVPSLTFDTVCDSVGTKDTVSSNKSINFGFSNDFLNTLSGTLTRTSVKFNNFTIDGTDLFYINSSSDVGLLYQIPTIYNLVEYNDSNSVLIAEGYSTFLTKCLSAGVDFNVTVTAGSITKTFNVNVVVSAESVDIPSDIEF